VPEARPPVRGKRDLWHHNQRAPPAAGGLGDQAQVNLGLARSRHPRSTNATVIPRRAPPPGACSGHSPGAGSAPGALERSLVRFRAAGLDAHTIRRGPSARRPPVPGRQRRQGHTGRLGQPPAHTAPGAASAAASRPARARRPPAPPTAAGVPRLAAHLVAHLDPALLLEALQPPLVGGARQPAQAQAGSAAPAAPARSRSPWSSPSARQPAPPLPIALQEQLALLGQPHPPGRRRPARPGAAPPAAPPPAGPGSNWPPSAPAPGSPDPAPARPRARPRSP
jgi:hypothetical protein